jgi:hypothetical protein
VSKRSATQRAETPNPPQGGGGAQQFRATPRFSLHSTPRDATATAPLLPSSTPRQSAFRRQRHPDDISDAIDSSPPAPHPSTNHIHDSIEDSSLLGSSAVPVDEDELLTDACDQDTAAPSPKRRRVAASPILDPTSSLVQESLADYEHGPEEDYHDDNDSIASDPSELPDVVSVNQPTFHKAPRFVPIEPPELSGREPLPDIFSPRRRGTIYIPGGLAAELRDWLVDIEAATGPKKEDDFLTKITINEVRRGTGMLLVTGRAVLDDGSPQEQNGTDSSARMMLAGEGRLVGLARKPEVVVGSVVGIAKPVWDVNLGVEGWWTVACDWVVL